MRSLSPDSQAFPGLLCLALVLLLGALWGSGPLVHDDLFLHLGTGRHVVEQGEVPTTDIFSFTRFGERWVSHEWGFGLAVYAVWLTTGYAGLVALKALLVVAILGLLFWIMWRRSGLDLSRVGPLHAALLAVGLWAISDQLILRASLFSSLFILILVLLLDRFDRSDGRLTVTLVVALFLVWGNFHGEVLFGLFLLGVKAVEAILGRHDRSAERLPSSLLQVDPRRPYLRLFGAALVATQLNPNGIQVLLYPFRLAAFLFTRGDTLEMGHFGGATPTDAAGFYLLIALVLLASLPVTRLKALSLTDVLTSGAFLVLSLRSHRFIFFFCLFALPALAALIGRRSTAGARPIPLVRSVFVAATMILVGIASVAAWQQRTDAPLSRHFPAASVRLLKEEGVEGRVFNHQNYGGYLRWQRGEPVFWDGRNLVFASLMAEIATMPLAEVTRKWDLEALLLTEFEIARIGDQIDPSRWGLVHWDDFAALYLHRSDRSESTLGRLELRHFPPFGGVEGLNLRARDDAWTAAARRELDQILHREPNCQRALYLQGLISFYRGDANRAEDELQRALALGSNAYVEEALERVLARTDG